MSIQQITSPGDFACVESLVIIVVITVSLQLAARCIPSVRVHADLIECQTLPSAILFNLFYRLSSQKSTSSRLKNSWDVLPAGLMGLLFPPIVQIADALVLTSTPLGYIWEEASAHMTIANFYHQYPPSRYFSLSSLLGKSNYSLISANTHFILLFKYVTHPHTIALLDFYHLACHSIVRRHNQHHADI